jgi:L-malate glycosyltransferase
MKIGITCYPTYGGSGVVATELGIELAARGHQVHFITYQQPFRLTGREVGIHFHEVAVTSYPLFQYPPYDLSLASRMAEVAEFYGLDLLHVHYAIPHSVSALLARQMLEAKGIRLPFITTLHGTDITLVGQDPGDLPITRFGIEQSDGVTSISADLKNTTERSFGITREIEVIRNFVNCDLYKPDEARRQELRERFQLGEDKVLLHLSNFRRVKRIGDVVEVFARVQREVASRLILIGDGPDRSMAESLATRYGIQDKILFLGKQDSVQDLLPVGDLMLMPSEMESFGLAALEGMACGVPCIATQVGGVPELVEHDSNGLLFPVGDVEGMADGAIAVLNDEPRRQRMAQSARKTAQDKFCTSRIIPLYERYYESVLAR